MNLHDEIMNLNPEKRKQNLAIDEAVKKYKSLHEIMVAVYARGHRDARHSAAEKATQQTANHAADCAINVGMLGECDCGADNP